MQESVHLHLQNVTTEVLAKICNELKCDVGDIMEFIPDENE